uniref:VIP1 N-terminal domain-containing protein n=1 Tax=Romanomermis culicivorax TaxID=13658 RepID=A0A915HD94_ROMCU
MAKKAKSKPMRSILGKLTEIYGEFLDIVLFPEEIIVNESIENWPWCDALISFHSKDFPLSKAVEYIKLRGVWAVNDLERALDLLNRDATDLFFDNIGSRSEKIASTDADPG